MKSFSLYIPGIVALVVLVTGFLIANAFTPPTLPPPGGDVLAPLNVGTSSQTKAGGLLSVFDFWVDNAMGVTGGATFGGNVGIGDTTPVSLLTVGTGDLFQVNSSGDLVRISNIPYSWPSAQGAVSTVLTNNGAGTLSWGTVAGGMTSFDIADTVDTTQFTITGGADKLQFAAGTGISVAFDSINDRVTYTNSGDTTSDTIADDGLISISEGGTGATIASTARSNLIAAGTGSCAIGSSIRVIDSTGVVACEVDDVGAGGITGSGTINTIPLFTGATTLGDSIITQSGATILIGGGTGKLTVGTIDPVYEIDGKKYATYVADFAGGVKTEVTGILIVQNGTKIIDFDAQQTGSDLWLFWETSTKNVGDITALLTPGFEDNVWYEKIPSDNKIIIRSNQNGEVSFRLTAPRKDAGQWPNEITE